MHLRLDQLSMDIAVRQAVDAHLTYGKWIGTSDVGDQSGAQHRVITRACFTVSRISNLTKVGPKSIVYGRNQDTEI